MLYGQWWLRPMALMAALWGLGGPEGWQVCVGRGTRPGSHPLPATRWRMRTSVLVISSAGRHPPLPPATQKPQLQRILVRQPKLDIERSGGRRTHREPGLWGIRPKWWPTPGWVVITRAALPGPWTRSTLVNRSCLRRGSKHKRPCSLLETAGCFLTTDCVTGVLSQRWGRLWHSSQTSKNNQVGGVEPTSWTPWIEKRSTWGLMPADQACLPQQQAKSPPEDQQSSRNHVSTSAMSDVKFKCQT